MYMAFVIHEDNEDRVSFYVRGEDGQYKIFTEYVARGDSGALSYYIRCYMFEDKEKQNNIVVHNDV